MKLKFLILVGLLGILVYSCSNESQDNTISVDANSSAVIPDVIDFNFHVKPILSDRCFKCHGPDKNKVEGGLVLHTRAGAFAALGENKDHYAIVPNDVENSFLINRIYEDDPELKMPPPESNLKLEDYEKEILKKWVEQGATWKEHWAFIPPVQKALPKVTNTDWVQNEIDNFVLAKLEEQNILPSEKASKEKLIRRLSFDLTGLAPDPSLIDAYLVDDSPEHYAQIIDQLLVTTERAEKMANGWLDLARYADTHGYQDDFERFNWPWRDWLIHAFKKNMPYDQFVTWQLAGDLLANPTKEQILATTFNRNHKVTQEGGVIPEEYRVEYVSDRTNTFSTAFLGLTFECAKCHDHKYDPISQKDYYQLFSYFNNVPEKGLIEQYGANPEPIMTLTQSEIDEKLSFINNLDSAKAIPVMVMEELKEPRQAYVLNRGAYDQLGEEVFPTTPSFGGNRNNEFETNRLGLSKWLFSDDNPLTARVAVNRIWQQLFGKGLVATSFDFGNQGALPKHPALLDYLAVKFKNEGWDINNIVKFIVQSATYQQSSNTRPDLQEIDPENDLLARAPRARLTAEMIRDHALNISGLLVKKVGGPSVKPYQPEGLWNEVTGGGGGSTAKYVQDKGDKNYRRSLYTFWKRTVPPPNMMTFDTPSRDFCTVQREQTSTPLQALVLMNDPQYLEAAKALAMRSLSMFDKTEEIISYMFSLATSRKPKQDEIEILSSLFEEEKKRFNKSPKDSQLFLSVQEGEKSSSVDLAAYTYIANVIINLDETIRKN